MNISVASGKGGTGKTTFSVNLAYALADRGEKVRLLDCDVEEPNDHLFVQPRFTEQMPVELMKPVWDESVCTACGDCARACHYNAIAVVKKRVLVFNELCHSCGVCSYVCPEKALAETPVAVGVVEAAPQNEPFYFAHGVLNIAEALAPAIVRKVKAHCAPDAINIIDSSPGTACPVVEAVTDSDVAVMVTEPTPFGLHDLKLAVGLSLKRRVPTCIVVNRSDGTDSLIADWAERVNVPLVGRIPFDRAYAEAYSSAVVLSRSFPGFEKNILAIFDRIVELAGTRPPDPPVEESFDVKGDRSESFEAGDAETYRDIAIVSGKGGSGKTTVVSSLAMLTDKKVLSDNDVDAADLHLLLAPTVREAHDFVGGQKAVIDPAVCTACRECEQACHFDAIRHDGPPNEKGVAACRIDDLACEGCGLCGYVCQYQAVLVTPSTVGKWFVSSTGCGPMAHARLGIAEENSGRLVTQVRNVSADLARNLKLGLILGDGPPGTGCPVIASVSGTDQVLIVTEPTVSGVHDMERVLRLTSSFGVPAQIVINKADLNPAQAGRIESIASEMGSEVVARVPFDRNVNDALMACKTVVEYGRGPAYDAMLRLAEQLNKT